MISQERPQGWGWDIGAAFLLKFPVRQGARHLQDGVV